MTRKASRMSQEPALSTQHVELTEVLVDEWRDATADGHVCATEMARITVVITTVNRSAGVVDLALATGLAIARRGIEAQRPTRLLAELTDLQNQAA